MHSIKDDWGIDDVVIAEIEKGTYVEGEALCWWMAMLKMAAPESTLFDVGSYTGLYSLLAASVRTDVRTIAIEASVVTYGRLVQNILVNGFDMRVLPNHVAISNKAGIAKLGHAYGPLSMASGESLDPNYETDHSELVPSVSLDDLIFQTPGHEFGAISSKSMGVLPLKCIAGMKIDVEGVELNVLKGASKLLATFRPPLIIEILEADKLTSCDSILFALGYSRITRCDGDNYIYCFGDKNELVSIHKNIVSEGLFDFRISEAFSISL